MVIMMGLKKMHPALKEQFCEQLYEKYIVGSSEKLMRYEEYAYTIHAKMPVSCYTNSILYHLSDVAESLLEDEEVTDDVNKQIRKCLHNLKNANLRK